jgi:glutamine cyclotransferase
MLFGITKFYQLNYIALFLLSILSVASCNRKDKSSARSGLFITAPESGTVVKSGEEVQVKLNYGGAAIDSIQYFLDTTKLAVKTDTSAFNLKSANFPLGSRLITVKIFGKDIQEELTTNVVFVSAKTPEQYGYEIVNSYKHDVSSYTQGLEFKDGIFYESDGEYGASSLRKVALNGTVMKQLDLDKKYFAEGITVIGDKIIQLTYKERVILEYDKNTFELLKTYPYNHANEGWGLAYDGETIYNTDGSNKIFKLNKTTYQPEGFIEVYDDKGPVVSLNELEWIDGKIYANIYTSDLIAIINPQTGEVEAYINLIGLRNEQVEDESQDVLNGIAWDAKGKRLFVTGKKWPKLFEIKKVKRN